MGNEASGLLSSGLERRVEGLEFANECLMHEIETNPHWANQMSKAIWPTVTAFLMDMIIKQLEPMFAAMPQLAGLTFDKDRCTMGTKAVEFIDMRVLPPRADGNLMMKGTVNWEGELDVILNYSRFSFGIKNLCIAGPFMMRADFIRELPLLDGFKMFFLDRPRISFDFDGAASILDYIPGNAKHMVLDVVNEAVAKTMVLPNRFGILLNEKGSIYKLAYPPVAGMLWVKVWKATNLRPAHPHWYSSTHLKDSVCQVRLGATVCESPAASKRKHPAMAACLPCSDVGSTPDAPVFGYEVPMPVAVVGVQSLELRILDVQHPELPIGDVIIPLNGSHSLEGQWRCFDLVNKCAPDDHDAKGLAGKIWVQTCWQPIVSNPILSNSGCYAEIFVGIEKAHGIPRAGNMATAFSVELECSNLLDVASQDQNKQQTMGYLPDAPTGTEVHLKREGERLHEKIEMLRNHGVPQQDIAKILDLPLDLVEQLVNPAMAIDYTHIFSNAGDCEIVWEEARTFLVKSADTAKLSFKMLGHDTKSGKHHELGARDFGVLDVLERKESRTQSGYGTADEITHYEDNVDNRRSFQKKIKMKDNVHLHITVRIGYFGPSGIPIN